MSVNVSNLRIKFCGSDKMPLNFNRDAFTCPLPTRIHDRLGNSLGWCWIDVDPASPPKPGKRSSSKHRIFVWVNGVRRPIGRLMQLKEWKDGWRPAQTEQEAIQEFKSWLKGLPDPEVSDPNQAIYQDIHRKDYD